MRKFAFSLLNYSFNNIITHIPIRAVRLGYLRLFNRNIHSSVAILMHTRILNFWKIHIEEGVVIGQYGLLDCRMNNIYIGKHSDIGPYTRIWTLGHNPNSPTHSTYGGDVIIGHHVWISSGVTILPGLTIADGSVVGASAVVHKTTEKNDILVGNPAKVIKKRQNDLTYKLNFISYFE